jgi:hypothetical protein
MSDSEGELGIFEEPEGFYEPEKEPSFVDYTLQNGLKLNLRLVGHNPLWVSLHCLLLLTYVESSTVGSLETPIAAFSMRPWTCLPCSPE